MQIEVVIVLLNDKEKKKKIHLQFTQLSQIHSDDEKFAAK
jgi:hypothetical protein